MDVRHLSSLRLLPALLLLAMGQAVALSPPVRRFAGPRRAAVRLMADDGGEATNAFAALAAKVKAQNLVSERERARRGGSGWRGGRARRTA